MSSDLYFIAAIVRAVRQRHPEDALRQAFAEIVTHGQQPACQNGFHQFTQFMAVAAQRFEQIEEVTLRRAILELAAGTVESRPTDADAILRVLQRNLRWQREYEQWLAEAQEFPEPTGFDLLLLVGDETPIGRVRLRRGAQRGTIGRVVPGEYLLALDTGWVLWEDGLTDRDLLWAEAFPGRPLKFAADTGMIAGEPSRRFDLLGGELTMHVFPGVEAGRIELRWRGQGGQARGG